MTCWMQVRHQILRHLDAAWEARDGRSELMGLIIVEESRVQNEVWQNYPETLRSAKVLPASLPHRTEEERAQIGAAFHGITTWQAVCRRFRIPLEALLDEVV